MTDELNCEREKKRGNTFKKEKERERALKEYDNKKAGALFPKRFTETALSPSL